MTKSIPHIKQTKPYQNSLLCPGAGAKEDNPAIFIPHIDWITVGIPKEALAELFKEDETSMTETDVMVTIEEAYCDASTILYPAHSAEALQNWEAVPIVQGNEPGFRSNV